MNHHLGEQAHREQDMNHHLGEQAHTENKT